MSRACVVVPRMGRSFLGLSIAFWHGDLREAPTGERTLLMSRTPAGPNCSIFAPVNGTTNYSKPSISPGKSCRRFVPVRRNMPRYASMHWMEFHWQEFLAINKQLSLGKRASIQEKPRTHTGLDASFCSIPVLNQCFRTMDC